ncbi:haloacid dehalogenase [Actinoplanes ianthinogenes]|uniref:Haloacid dehalogenase n=1 Tax=Actinoplanes ianthinogenes TaxID=122358 RepID=A0ABM7LWE9_9ACTN|nr:HAD family hydrolase [Actinoplanes ianthinogenes]BCJ43551.1 haloacid dehalogenase [Actinoplanes ianthinogenes]GGR19286.1 haloacid dehalogenase [Actinoplanes ianthinogenes]
MAELPHGGKPEHNRRFRLVATDIDGTLINSERLLSRRTIDTLAAVPVPVVLVTGRPLRWLEQLYDQLPAPLPAVCLNGAVIYDPHTDEVLRTEPLSSELLIDVVARLRDAVPDISLAVEIDDGRAFRHEASWPRLWVDHRVQVISSPAELTSVPAVKLLVRSATADPDDFLELVSKALGGVAEATRSSSSALVEISAAGVTKAAGLAWLCERDGIAASEVIAFGDMPNDIPMLTWAGHAVAMGNAHEAVRAVADATTASNEDDGVAVYLRKAFNL